VLRVTFMRRIAPSQEASRKSGKSSGAKVPAISPMAWASAMQRRGRAPFRENGSEGVPAHVAQRRRFRG